jgi:hypothetical protein
VTDIQEDLLPDLVIKNIKDNGDTKTTETIKVNDKDILSLGDFYKDCRTFFEKASSTKFVVTMFVLITNPLLLYFGVLPSQVYQEIILLTTLTYLGVDVYEKKITRKKV